MTKVIILGSSGFIGKHLYQHLCNKINFEVKGFSSRECNLLSLKSIKVALNDVSKNDILIMTSSITRLKENSYESMCKNILMAENLIKFIEHKPINKLIFLSTIEAYGNIHKNIKLTEKTLPNPSNYYSISKITSEYILSNACEKLKIPLLIFRMPGVYGPEDYGNSTINNLVESALNGRIVLYNNGADFRDFVFINDICDAIKISMNCEINDTINLVSGQSYSIKKIAEIIQKELKHRVIIDLKCSENQTTYLNFNNSSFHSKFPDFKFTPIEVGIKKYIDFMIHKNKPDGKYVNAVKEITT